MPFQIVRNNIVDMEVDAIVNAANYHLQPGGGVCGAIFEAAGYDALQKACEAIGHCPTGSAVITPGFALKAKYIIHTVGPVWQGGYRDEEALLRSAYTSSMELAVEHGLRSIAFPLISSGIYGYPKDQALQIALSSIQDFLIHNEDLDVWLVVLDRAAFSLSEKLFSGIQSYIDAHFINSVERSAQQRIIPPPVMANPIPYEFRLPDTARDHRYEPFHPEKMNELLNLFRKINKSKNAPPPTSPVDEDADSEGANAPREESADKISDSHSFQRELTVESSSRDARIHVDPPLYRRAIDDPYKYGQSDIAQRIPDSTPLPDLSPSDTTTYTSEDRARFAESRAALEAWQHAKEKRVLEEEKRRLEIHEIPREDAPPPRTSKQASVNAAGPTPSFGAASIEKLHELLHRRSSETFSEMVLRLIDEKGFKKDSIVYKRANLYRSVFSKLRSSRDYMPSKSTAIALAIALELNLDQTRDLLSRAGYALSPSDLSDIIISYFIENGLFDIATINAVLFSYDRPILGAHS